MGRPLNKRLFADATTGPTASGNEIKVDFHNGSAVKEGFIVRQKGSKRFLCSETGAADTTHLCTLVTGKLKGALAAGEMIISVKGSDNETYGLSKISGRVATLVAPTATGSNALDNTRQAWGFAAPSTGIAQIEEAGDDDALGGDDDDFTDDA
jgi:ribosomal protein L27